MSGVVLLESFDYQWGAQATPNGLQATWVKGYLDQSLVPGRYGGWCLRHTRAGGTEDINRDFPAGNITTGQITLGFDWRVSNLVSRPLMRLMQNATTTSQFTIYQNSDGSISIRNGNSGTVLGTSAAGVIAINTWYFIEVAVAIDNSGSAEVRVTSGGVTATVINVSGVDTMGAANLNVGRINLPEPDSSGTMWYDNLYVRDDLTFMGPHRVIYRRPLTALVGDFDLTATAATPYPLRVDDQAADTSSYIAGDTVSDEQLFTMEGLGRFSGTDVAAVQVIAFARTDAGTATLAPVVSSNGDVAVGSNWALDTTFRFRFQMFNSDPDTGAAWTRAALSLAYMGARITGMTGAAAVRVSLIGYEVLVPAGNIYAEAGGHRYWSLKGITNNGGSRPGTWMLNFHGADGERLQRLSASGEGGLWSGSNDYHYATDGRSDTGYISGSSTPSTRLIMDYGGPVIATNFALGSQTFLLTESFRTYSIDYSDDGVTWTTLYTETTPQTGWASGEMRYFALPSLTPASGRRRQTLALN